MNLLPINYLKANECLKGQGMTAERPISEVNGDDRLKTW